MELDRRLHAFRPDLAEAALEGRVEAAAFTPGAPARIALPVADLRPEPDPAVSLDSQLLLGERVTLFERREAAGIAWAWVKNAVDGYVGYVPAEAIEPETEASRFPDPTHRVVVPAAHAYPEPRLKAPALLRLSYMTELAVQGAAKDGFVETEAGWVYEKHLAPPDERQPDYIASALAFLGVPYLWGGRSSLGLDCSALIQLVLAHAGLPCPRDTDLQARGLEAEVVWRPGAGRYQPRRGDIAFMPRHVVIMLDQTRVVHANAFDLQVSTDSLGKVLERVAAESGRDPQDALDIVRRP